MQTNIDKCTHEYIGLRTFFHAHIQICMHTCIHTYIHTYILTSTHTHLYIYTYLYTHTHAYKDINHTNTIIQTCINCIHAEKETNLGLQNEVIYKLKSSLG